MAFRSLICIAAVSFYSSPADAAPLYSQVPTTFSYSGSTSYLPLPISADDFAANATWQIDSASFEGVWRNDFVGAPDDGATRLFRVQFYQDDAGVPTEIPFVNREIAASVEFVRRSDQHSVYEMMANFTEPVVLLPSTKYWLAIADIGPSTGSDGFFWSVSYEGNLAAAQKDAGGWRSFNTRDKVFTLFGSVIPEPTSALSLLFLATLQARVERRVGCP